MNRREFVLKATVVAVSPLVPAPALGIPTIAAPIPAELNEAALEAVVEELKTILLAHDFVSAGPMNYVSFTSLLRPRVEALWRRAYDDPPGDFSPE